MTLPEKEGDIPMQRTETYQDTFLNQARKERTPLTVFLVNGFQMRGIITGFDAFVIVLASEGRQQMIYKHRSYNKPGSVHPRKCRSEIYLKRERMPCRHHSYTDPAYGNGTAGRHDRGKPSDRKII